MGMGIGRVQALNVGGWKLSVERCAVNSPATRLNFEAGVTDSDAGEPCPETRKPDSGSDKPDSGDGFPG
jgi:hypothetical protein